MVHETDSYINNYHLIINTFYDFAIEAYQSKNCYSLSDQEAVIVYDVLDEAELLQTKVASITASLIDKYGDGFLFRESFVEELQKNSIYFNENIIEWMGKNKSLFPSIELYLKAIEDLNIVTFLYLQKISKEKSSHLLYKCYPEEFGFFYFSQIPKKCCYCKKNILYFFPFKEKKICISCLSNNVIVDGGYIIDWIKLHLQLAITQLLTRFFSHPILEGNLLDGEVHNYPKKVCTICQCEYFSYFYDDSIYYHYGCKCNQKKKCEELLLDEWLL